MPILISVLVLLLGVAFATPAMADFTDVFISGSLFSYDDQTAVTQTNALAGSVSGTNPIPCFLPLAGSSSCFSPDQSIGALDTASGQASASVSGTSSTNPSVTTFLSEFTSASVSASKTTFAAAAAFSRAGADMSVAGILTGDTPVVDLGGIVLFGGTDPLGTLFALEITDQTPSLASKLLNNDIRSLSLLGSSAKSILGTPGGWTESNPSKIFYKLVATLLPDGTLSISDGGLLGSGHVTAADFISGCGSVTVPIEGTPFFTPGLCPDGVQTQRTLVFKRISNFPGLPDPQAFTIDIVKLEVATAVPEPSALLLVGSGLFGAAGWRIIRRSR
jgi:hypothetical protein